MDDTAPEHGFTLVELMVVVAIVGVLIGIALPTFVGAQERAGERRAQAQLRNAALTARTIASSNGLFEEAGGTPLDVSDLQASDASLVFASDVTEAAGPDVVYVVVADDPDDPLEREHSLIHVYSSSAPGRWFGLSTTSTGVVRVCDGPTVLEVWDPANCLQARW